MGYIWYKPYLEFYLLIIKIIFGESSMIEYAF